MYESIAGLGCPIPLDSRNSQYKNDIKIIANYAGKAENKAVVGWLNLVPLLCRRIGGLCNISGQLS